MFMVVRISVCRIISGCIAIEVPTASSQDAVSVSEGARTEVPDLRSICCPHQLPPHTRAGIRESAEFDWAGENPVFSARKIGLLLPDLQVLQQFGGEGKGPCRPLRLYVAPLLAPQCRAGH